MTYVADPSCPRGAGAGWTGPVDCLAHATTDVIDQTTNGHKDPPGRTIRQLSNEPRPDAGSPGLNLPQVADVAIEHFGVFLDVRIGSRALTFEKYEEERKAGRAAVIQLNYKFIADSPFDAGRGFRGGHGMAETIHSDYDPLAGPDERHGIWHWKPQLYPRELIKLAAGGLVTSPGHSVGYGHIWCALARDVVPNYLVDVHPRPKHSIRKFRVFKVEHGVITGYRVAQDAGFRALCSPPRAFRWPGHDGRLRFLVQITAGKRKGQWIHSHWSEER
jgi:hypothetical protein